jgi:uncharacterized membrane protein
MPKRDGYFLITFIIVIILFFGIFVGIAYNILIRPNYGFIPYIAGLIVVILVWTKIMN